jgi:beta-lactamase superfamily II metal-dependent hydrolase
LKIQITMVDVEDGDAIIIFFEGNGKKHVSLIDGGRRQYAEKVIGKLDAILKKAGKQSPDLLVVTHYDSDHIGGIPAIIDKYKNGIRELWIHKPGTVIENSFTQKNHQTNLLEIAKEEKLIAEIDVVMESINELREVIDKAQKHKIFIKEPFANETSFDNLPELRVIGPTKEYYNGIFKDEKAFESFVFHEALGMKLEQSLHPASISQKTSCSRLPTTSKITQTNKASVIIKVVAEDKSYLFTGDAGIESFHAISNYEKELKDIYWVKVPHHGSINNISEDLIKIMNAKFAFVSGKNYIDDPVLKCFKDKGGTVKDTRAGDLFFPENRERFQQLLKGMK